MEIDSPDNRIPRFSFPEMSRQSFSFIDALQCGCKMSYKALNQPVPWPW
jgi:hypothetical protein